MERKHWTLALLLALRKAQLRLFQDWFKGHGAWEPQECNSTQMKSSTTPHSPTGTSEVAQVSGAQRNLLPRAMGSLILLYPCDFLNVRKTGTQAIPF